MYVYVPLEYIVSLGPIFISGIIVDWSVSFLKSMAGIDKCVGKYHHSIIYM